MAIKTFTIPVCLQCFSKNRNTCCTNSPRGPLTIEDIERIQSAGYKIPDFISIGEYDPDTIRDDEDWWQKSLIPVNGKLYKTNVKKTSRGECFFLDKKSGCLLSEKRPYICRIYPFWLDAEGKIYFDNGNREYCFFGNIINDVDKGLSHIAETHESVRIYFEKIRQDCIENTEKHRQIIENKLRS